MFIHPVTYHKTEIEGWYKLIQEYEEIDYKNYYSHQFVIGIDELFRGSDLIVSHVPTPKVVAWNIKLVSTYSLNGEISVPSDQLIEIPIEIIGIKRSIDYKDVFDLDFLVWLCDDVKDEIISAIKERGWTDVFIRENGNILNHQVFIKSEFTWRQFMGWHNNIGRVDEKHKIKSLIVRWWLHIGGYKKERMPNCYAYHA